MHEQSSGRRSRPGSMAGAESEVVEPTGSADCTYLAHVTIIWEQKRVSGEINSNSVKDNFNEELTPLSILGSHFLAVQTVEDAHVSIDH